MRRPSTRAAKPSGKGKRRSGRRSSARAMMAPSMAGASPRLTVSTSGNSAYIFPFQAPATARRATGRHCVHPLDFSPCRRAAKAVAAALCRGVVSTARKTGLEEPRGKDLSAAMRLR